MKNVFGSPPAAGDPITATGDNRINIPDNPIVGFIEGDGVGPDIWAAAKVVLEAAVERAWADKRSLQWWEIPAGQKAFDAGGEYLPDETFVNIEEAKVVIKGPLTTPVSGGFRSLNVTLRQKLDLYACVRPVKYIPGTPAPVSRPQDVDMVIFRENTEDVYAGIEWQSNSDGAGQIIGFLKDQMGITIDPASGIGIKPMSPKATKRLVRRAIQYALENGRRSVTLVHKGNIMKFTEGAFREWGYEVAKEEFADQILLEDELARDYNGVVPNGRVLINDRIADSMFQQALLRPKEYDVLALPNLNGDYLSDALAAQVGGLGMAPGANMGDSCAIFEATHGSAPKYAGLDKVNPGSLILSGVLMLQHMGWNKAADLIVKAVTATIQAGTVTYDLARQMPRAQEVSCFGFGRAIIDNM
ncbi:isocitrate dehydrogenase (NADP(+)) [Thermodesulfobacteriota bacterium]